MADPSGAFLGREIRLTPNDSADTTVAAQQGIVPPAIALSGYGTEQDIKSSRDAGFREHITKPVDLDRLEKTVRQMLR